MRQLIAVALLLTSAPAALQAQSGEVDRRVDRLEREVRALQREVFPGGSGQFFEPEIRPGTSGSQSAGNPASAPITDLIDRVNALERQLATLTGQVEENSYRLRQIEAAIEGMQAAEEELDDDIPGFDDQAETTPPPREEAGEAVSGNLRAMAEQERESEEAPAIAVDAEEGAAPTGQGPFRAQGSEPPLPDDPGEASYVRGYRLWRDGDYAAAREQLRQTVEEFPGHRFESYARNLLGRAYLDDDKPASATEIFVRNYQELPNGERAADSLFFLGVALTRLDYRDRACLAFAELEEVYGGSIRSDIAEQLPSARDAAGCD